MISANTFYQTIHGKPNENVKNFFYFLLEHVSECSIINSYKEQGKLCIEQIAYTIKIKYVRRRRDLQRTIIVRIDKLQSDHIVNKDWTGNLEKKEIKYKREVGRRKNHRLWKMFTIQVFCVLMVAVPRKWNKF